MPFTELTLMLTDTPRLVEQGKTSVAEKEFDSDEELIEFMMK